MTPKQKQLVQLSFVKMSPASDQVAAAFYRRLFELDPTIEPLFASADMKEQGRKFMHMIAVAVKSLTRLEEIVPAVEEMGRRHATYGAVDDHYETMGEALLWALDQQLGEEFTPEVRKAWAAAYEALADTMKAAVVAT